MESDSENDWTLLSIPSGQNIGGNEVNETAEGQGYCRLPQGLLANITNRLVTGFFYGVSYMQQSLGLGRHNQLQLETIESLHSTEDVTEVEDPLPADYGSLHSTEDITEVKDPLHLGKVVKNRTETDSISIQSLGPVINSEIGSLHSDQRNSRASSQTQQPAQSKRLRSCDRAEPQGKRMCREDEEKKQDQKNENKGEKEVDEKKRQEKKKEKQDQKQKQAKKEKHHKKEVDEKKEQEETEENELEWEWIEEM